MRRRVIEVRRELHAIGFPADDVADDRIARGMVLVRRGEHWEVMEGYRLLHGRVQQEWTYVTTLDATPTPIYMAEIAIRGPAATGPDEPGDGMRLAAWNAHGWYSTYAIVYEILEDLSPDGARRDVTLRSSGIPDIRKWGDRPG
jgi:hypothetical protein